MSLDTLADGREILDYTPDSNAWLFNCYLIGLKRRNPWFLVATRYFMRRIHDSPSRILRDFEFDRFWNEMEAVIRFRRRISFEDDYTFDSVFPFRRLLVEVTSFVSLTSLELEAILAGKSRESLELRFEHFFELLKGYPGASFDDLISAMDSHWKDNMPSISGNVIRVSIK